jgi:hypothetical protein
MVFIEIIDIWTTNDIDSYENKDFFVTTDEPMFLLPRFISKSTKDIYPKSIMWTFTLILFILPSFQPFHTALIYLQYHIMNTYMNGIGIHIMRKIGELICGCDCDTFFQAQTTHFHLA